MFSFESHSNKKEIQNRNKDSKPANAVGDPNQISRDCMSEEQRTLWEFFVSYLLLNIMDLLVYIHITDFSIRVNK